MGKKEERRLRRVAAAQERDRQADLVRAAWLASPEGKEYLRQQQESRIRAAQIIGLIGSLSAKA